MEKIKSKKSYDIDFEDLLDDIIIKKHKKKKKKKKHKSSKKSSNKKKKITKDLEINSDFFGLNDKETKLVKKRYNDKITHRYNKSFFGRILDSINIDANFNVDISDEVLSSLLVIASGFIAKLFIKKWKY